MESTKRTRALPSQRRRRCWREARMRSTDPKRPLRRFGSAAAHRTSPTGTCGRAPVSRVNTSPCVRLRKITHTPATGRQAKRGHARSVLTQTCRRGTRTRRASLRRAASPRTFGPRKLLGHKGRVLCGPAACKKGGGEAILGLHGEPEKANILGCFWW